MSNIKISIIIPIYNAEKYLSECFDSVFGQSFEGTYEAIVVLNPCTDKSPEIVEKYSKKYHNLKVIHMEKLSGPAICRFRGLEEASGDYICFIDADDKYHYDYLKTLYNEAIKGNDVVNCSFFSYKEDVSKKDLFTANKKYDSVHSVKALLWDASFRSFLWNKMFKRELFTKGKLYYPKRRDALFEDTLIVFSLLLNAKSVKSIKNPLYYYRINPTSLTQVVNKERFNYHLYTFALIRHLCDQAGPEYVKAFRKTYKRSYWSLWFDAGLLKKQFGHGAFKHLHLHKHQLKLLKSKKPLPVEGEVWESYIKECL